MVQGLENEKKSRKNLYWGESNLLPLEQSSRRQFSWDTNPGGNFPAANIPCLEYKQDHFFNEDGNNY